jgi:hypothetical protein
MMTVLLREEVALAVPLMNSLPVNVHVTQSDQMIKQNAAPTSVPIPKFANPCGTSDANFGIKGTLANISF